MDILINEKKLNAYITLGLLYRCDKRAKTKALVVTKTVCLLPEIEKTKIFLFFNRD